MLNSHAHLISEEPERYAEALRLRMAEHGIRRSVLFGAQVEQATDDAAVREAALRYPDAFVPFLSRSVDIARPDALEVCLGELESGFWKGVGEIFLDCTNDETIRWTDREGREHCVVKPVPQERERDPLYEGIFRFCSEAKLPVLVHCMDAAVMERTLERYPDTTFLWAHVDHGFWWDVPAALLERHDNLFCEIGVTFRFQSKAILSGQWEPWLPGLIAGWQEICRRHPLRVIWGLDLFTWDDLNAENFASTMEAWKAVTAELDLETERLVSGGNLARLLKIPEK